MANNDDTLIQQLETQPDLMEKLLKEGDSEEVLDEFRKRKIMIGHYQINIWLEMQRLKKNVHDSKDGTQGTDIEEAKRKEEMP